MPTIVVIDGFRIMILNPPREHGPPHVHVIHGKGPGAGEVVIELGNPFAAGSAWTPVRIREVKGLQDRDVLTAVRIVQAHHIELFLHWSAIHGDASPAPRPRPRQGFRRRPPH